jgi:uncharacterized membrane protein
MLLATLAVATVVLGIGFRLWNLTNEPLWLDEAYSTYAASKGLTFLWTVVPQYETHPPFYYTLVWLWTLIFGDGLAALRSLGALCGIVAIGTGVLAAREIGLATGRDVRGRAVLMSAAAMLLALATLPIEMTREVRPYPVMTLVYAGLILALFRLANRMQAGAPLLCKAYIGYLALLALLLWLHNLGVLYAIAAGLALLILCWRQGWSRRDWTALIVGHGAVLLAWLPALAILSGQAPTWVQSTWLRFSFSERLPWAVARIFISATSWSAVCTVLLLVLAWLGLRRRSIGTRTGWALTILALLPVLLSLAISALIAPVFIPRTMSALFVPAMLLLALGATGGRALWVKLVAAAMLIVILADMIVADVRQRARPPAEDWYRLIGWLQPRFRPGDMVLAYPNEGVMAFRFALRDKDLSMPARAIPSEIPALNAGPGAWNPTGSRGVVSLSQPRLDAIAAQPDISRVPTIWLLRQGAWAYDKDDHFLHALERDRTRVGRVFSFPIEIIGLRRKDLAPVATAEQAKP